MRPTKESIPLKNRDIIDLRMILNDKTTDRQLKNKVASIISERYRKNRIVLDALCKAPDPIKPMKIVDKIRSLALQELHREGKAEYDTDGLKIKSIRAKSLADMVEKMFEVVDRLHKTNSIGDLKKWKR